jgi:hypothetical protein
MDDLSLWWVVLIIRGLYGLGRGVFEGSCRAVYASMFTGEVLITSILHYTTLH